MRFVVFTDASSDSNTSFALPLRTSFKTSSSPEIIFRARFASPKTISNRTLISTPSQQAQEALHIKNRRFSLLDDVPKHFSFELEECSPCPSTSKHLVLIFPS